MLNRVHSTAISSPSGLSIICITTNLSLSSDPFKTGFKNKCMTFWVVTFKQTFTTWHQITWPSSLSLLAVWLTLAALISHCLLSSPPPYSEPTLQSLTLFLHATQNLVASRTLLWRRILRGGMRYQKEEPWIQLFFARVNKKWSLFFLAKNNWDSWFFFLRSHSTYKTLSQKDGAWRDEILPCVQGQCQGLLSSHSLSPVSQANITERERDPFCCQCWSACIQSGLHSDSQTNDPYWSMDISGKIFSLSESLHYL